MTRKRAVEFYSHRTDEERQSAWTARWFDCFDQSSPISRLIFAIGRRVLRFADLDRANYPELTIANGTRDNNRARSVCYDPI
jgi:hypothetical protein